MDYKDDYSKAVFLHVYGTAKPLKKNNDYQRYLVFECGITGPRKYHEALINEGYFQLALPNDILSSLKVSELKEICDSLGIKKNGKKSDLISRILDSCNPEQIISFINEPLYSLSQKGKDFLETHGDYIELHKHKDWGITLDEYVEFKKTLPFKSGFKDVAWGIFNQRLIKYADEFGLLRNNYLHMALLMKEERQIEAYLNYLLFVLFFDVNEATTLYSLSFYNTKKEALDSYFCFAFKSGIPTMILPLQQYFKNSYVDEIYSQYGEIIYCLCDKDTFKNMIYDIFFDEEDYVDKYEAIFYLNYKKYVDKYFTSKKNDYRHQFPTSQPSHQNIHKNSSGCLSTVFTTCLVVLFLVLIGL